MAGASGSWRLSVKEIDRSSTVIGKAGSVGAMVIRASKGNAKPILVDKGQEKRIINLFGKPSASFPDVWEAIQYNKESSIWISAPYDSSALLGGVLVSDGGSTALSAGIDPDAPAYTFADGTEYFVLTASSPYDDDLAVKVTYNTTTKVFTIELYKTTDGTTYVSVDTYKVSLTEGTKDGFGQNIYIEEVLEDNDFLKVIVNSTRDIATNGFTDDSASVAFAGGDRGGALTITELTSGWDYFKQSNTYKADIFMDPTSDSGIPDLFNTLRNTYQKYASYIIPLPIGDTATTAITTKDGYSINNPGLAFYWNYARVKDTYNNSSFWTSLIGRVGIKFAQMADIFNGGAPAWIDENNHGGQLGSGIIEMKNDPTEDQLRALDEAGINPIVQYPGYGFMIVSQRTAQSPLNLSDRSWIAHSRLFDYIISNTLEQVLTYQIVKINDDYHRRLAKSKGETIIDPILAASLLSDAYVQCDTGNNDDNALAQRKFIFTVIVKVTPYSEQVVLEFVNIGQKTDINEIVG